MTEANELREVWITGVGLVSSLGIDAAAHKTHFETGTGHVIDEVRYAPYPVHPLVSLDWSKQIPKNSDQRQMETWQRIGVYAAGLALADAGLAGKPELLDRTDLVVAAGSGERDTKVDCDVLEAIHSDDETALLAKSVLPSALRPTLFLAQLSNMLAGNVSIVHHVTGSSRTFMGEESGAFAAAENAFRRISAGQADTILVDLLGGLPLDTVHRVNAHGTRIEGYRKTRADIAIGEAAQLRAVLEKNATPYLKVIGSRYCALALLAGGSPHDAVALLTDTLGYARAQKAGLEVEPYLLTALAEAMVATGSSTAHATAAEALGLAQRRAMRSAEREARALLTAMAGN